MDRKLFFKISQNTLYQGVGKLTSAFSTLIITVIITRQLGIVGYGDFIKAVSFVTPFYMVADFGFNATVVKMFDNNLTRMKIVLSELFGLRIFISLILIIFLVVVSFFLPYNQSTNQGFNVAVRTAIIIISFTIVFQSLFLSVNSYFQYKLSYLSSVLASMISSLITVVVIFQVTRIGTDISSISAAYLVGSFFLAASAIFLAMIRLGLFYPSINLQNWKFLIKKTLPIGLALIFNLVYFRVDSLIITILRPTEEVALYGLAYKIFEITLVAPIFLINSLYPVLLANFRNNQEAFLKIIKTAFWFLLTGSLVVTLFIILFAKMLILLIGGQQFLNAVLVLKLLAIGLPFFYLSALSMWLLIVFEKQKTVFAIYSLGALFNIILNLILIPKYGYQAAAVTTIISEALILIVSFIIIKTVLNKMKLEMLKSG